jgi:hypothetical protein
MDYHQNGLLNQASITVTVWLTQAAELDQCLDAFLESSGEDAQASISEPVATILDLGDSVAAFGGA